MADPNTVKKYIAYWFQLGKSVIVNKTGHSLKPNHIFDRGTYSQEFEQIWDLIQNPSMGDCYLDGTPQTIQDLLKSQWNIENCSRCEMPIPQLDRGVSPCYCPCADMMSWPNLELPLPRSPINNNHHLHGLINKLDSNEPSQHCP
ncbi:MAG: hypothetical protein HC796_03880 [Synechococcaceae cyanobacterium RL_1_2]|nr:hypothetical protein [Synechococcaceae cyanobacterium RL_1_2]